MTIKGLSAKLISKKGKIAEVEIESPKGTSQKLSVPSEYLPASSSPGSTFQLYFLDSNKAYLQEKKLAKYILEEILNGGD